METVYAHADGFDALLDAPAEEPGIVVDGDDTEDELDECCVADDDFPDFERHRVDEIPRNPGGKVMRYELRVDE